MRFAARVRPDDGRAQRAQIFAQAGETVHMPIQADAPDCRWVDAGLLHGLAHRLGGCRPPIIGVLFGITGLRVKNGVLAGSAGERSPAFRFKNDCFNAGCSEINAEQVNHSFITFAGAAALLILESIYQQVVEINMDERRPTTAAIVVPCTTTDILAQDPGTFAPRTYRLNSRMPAAA